MKSLPSMIAGMMLSLFSLTADAQDKPMTFTYKSHTYTMTGTLNADAYDATAKGTVTFTHIPADYAEFEAVYTQLLGKTPHGAAAMMPMAMELYRRDREVGLQCLKLLCYPTNVNSVTSILNSKYGASKFSPANDPYLQPYLPAAVQRGHARQWLYPAAAIHRGDEGQRQQAPGPAVLRQRTGGLSLCHGQGMGHRAAAGGGDPAAGQSAAPGIQLSFALYAVQDRQGAVERS